MKALPEPFTEKPSFLRFIVGSLLVPSPMAWVTDHKVPFKRWFFYLLVGTLFTLLAPYLANTGSSYHSPHLQFFTQEAPSQLVPVSGIWMDGPTYEHYQGKRWLILALSFILLETLVGSFRWLWQKLSARS
jgi:hypothetical protein